ncbi:MAG: hypothetical protein LLG01_11205 [Planctomycetaceae bacterium]|nr:hypothetical protein [Planctomycetaceae bacterium]
MPLTKRMLLGGLFVAALSVNAIQAADTNEVAGPFENIKTAPVAVTWQYSNDDGKTFSDKPLAGPKAGADPRHTREQFLYVFKGTFDVADPAKIAGLWVRITDGLKDTKATICNGDIFGAASGYWKDLGFCPTLLEASIKLNDKVVPFPHGGPLVQFWVPLTGQLVKGKNTVELRGNMYTFWQDKPAEALDALVVAAEAQPAEIYNGPILGDFGETYFTLACRTQLPADLTVEATPTEPAAAAVTVVSAGKIWHRVKVEVPKGTRKLSYTLTAKVGTHVTKRGPYAVTLGDSKAYRFVAFGHPQQQLTGDLDKEPLAVNSKLILKAQPDFVVNTGNLLEQGAWSFWWESAYIKPASELLARVPTLITPCADDYTGIFDELHYTPADDGYGHSWTKVMGPVRFIGIDGNMDWKAGGENAKWLEGVLKAATDKFVIVLAGYPAYSSGINSKKIFGGRIATRDVILPLCGKYKATMMLCSWDPTYERIELPPEKGCTQIVTGCIGRGSWHRWDTRMGSHPFGPPNGNARGTVGKVVRPDGGEWVGYFGTRHFCVFDVKDNTLEMKVLKTGPADADIKDLKVLDQKTFKPRN